MVAFPLDGLLCRILTFTNLAYSMLNQVTFEFSTSRHATTDGIAVCLTKQYDLDAVKITSVQQSSSQFDRNMVELASSLGDQANSVFFNGASKWSVPPVMVTNVTHLLSSDPYYAVALSEQRFEQLDVDPNWWRTFPWSQLPPSRSAWLPHTSSNSCLIITGEWKLHMKYQVTISVRNPDAAAAAGTDDASQVWIAPLTYEQMASDKSTSTPRFKVRGNKRGITCTWRAGLQPRYFDACKAATASGLLSGSKSTVQDCIEVLTSKRATLGPRPAYPYDQPPLSVTNTSTQPPVTCPAGKVMAASPYNECVDCTGATIEGGSCKCASNRAALLVGNQACGQLLTASGLATSSAAVADTLCRESYELHTSLLKGRISDAVIARNMLRLFAAKAAFILDWSDIVDANTSFWKEQTADIRHPGAAARNEGLAPNCNRCEKGLFLDIYTGKMVPVYDDRYQAVQTLRLIGYTLQTKGYTCNQLYTGPTMTMKQLYGAELYDDTICNPLPKVSL